MSGRRERVAMRSHQKKKLNKYPSTFGILFPSTGMNCVLAITFKHISRMNKNREIEVNTSNVLSIKSWMNENCQIEENWKNHSIRYKFILPASFSKNNLRQSSLNNTKRVIPIIISSNYP